MKNLKWIPLSSEVHYNTSALVLGDVVLFKDRWDKSIAMTTVRLEDIDLAILEFLQIGDSKMRGVLKKRFPLCEISEDGKVIMADSSNGVY